MKKPVKIKVDVVLEVEDTDSGYVADAVSELFTHNLEMNGVIKDWQYRKGSFNKKEIDIDPTEYREGDAF